MDPWERNRYPHTTNTRGAVHEVTVSWLDELLPGGPTPTYAPTSRPLTARAADIAARASQLAATHDLPVPDSTKWGRLHQTWGTCRHRHLVVNTEAEGFPQWVIDGIIVHELAHLVEPDHGPRFVVLVNRYPLAREVDGYLAHAQTVMWGIDQEPHLHRWEP